MAVLRGALVFALASTGCGDVVGVPIRAQAALGSGGHAPPAIGTAGAAGAAGGHAGLAASAGSSAKLAVAGTDSVVAGSGAASDVPAGPHCAPVASWPAQQVSAEDALYDALEAWRENASGSCGSGPGPSSGLGTLAPLRRVPELRCSARLHSLDMAARGYFDVTDPEGNGPGVRIAAAGLVPNRWGEAIERGSDPTRVLDRMLQSDPGGCMSFASPRFGAIGIGFGSGMWTLDFADR